MPMPEKDMPDFYFGIYSEIVNAYLETRAVVDNATIEQEVEDSYETKLDWDCLNLGKKMLFLKNTTPGTEDTGLTKSDATRRPYDGAEYTLIATRTIPAEDLLYAHITKVEGTVDCGVAGKTAAYKWTAQRAGGTEDTIITGTQAMAEAGTDYDYSEVLAFDRQIEVDLTIRAYYKRTDAGAAYASKNKVTYDVKLPGMDYRILTYAYKDKISYEEAQDALAAGESVRVVVSDVYTQLKAQAKCAVADMIAQVEMDYIGISL